MTLDGLPDSLRYETVGRKLYLTLNRPHAMNALDVELFEALGRAIEAFDADDQLLVAILTGAGGRAFSAGADLREVADAAGRPRTRDFDIRQFAGYAQLERCTKPIIAAIDGYCIAGGFELSLYCDMRVASRQSSFGLPEPRRSMLAGPALHQLSRMIPLGEALRIHLTGGRIPAERAHQIGLVQALGADRDETMALADELADEILQCAPLAVRAIKHIVRKGRELSVDESWALARPFQEHIVTTADALEGPRAFVEKRPPRWQMR